MVGGSDLQSLPGTLTDIHAVLTAAGVIRKVSDSVSAVLGYESAQLVGRSAFELVHPDDAPPILEAFLAGPRAQRGLEGWEFRLRHADGGWRVFVGSGRNMLAGARVAGMVITLRDAAARRRGEQALERGEARLRQAQKMEAVGRLAGGIAHDFNNLLTTIEGHTSLLLERARDPETRAGLQEVQRAAERAAALTRQLLAFSRKQVLQPEVLDLNAVVRDLETTLRRLIGEDVILGTTLERGLAQVMADPGQVEQVLMNLAVNARDAMPHGGRLAIETRTVDIGAEEADGSPFHIEPGRHVMLAVEDTGTGMDEWVQAHLFEPFFTTRGVGQGTGLGLSTVYGIVKQSGGFIRVHSTIGEGSRFEVFLPAIQGVARAPRPAAAPPRADTAGSETILVVEDEKAVRMLVKKVLARAGYAVLEASNGREALAVAGDRAGPIHVLLTDVVMPEMGGRELVEILAPLRPDMRVLFASGYTEAAIARHGTLAEGSVFLEKPFTPDILLRTVRSVLDERLRGD